VNGSWLLEELEELADGPADCAEIAGGRCSFTWNFSVTGSTVLTVYGGGEKD